VTLPARQSVSAAQRVVDRDRFCLDEQRHPLPQTSAVETISRMLVMLDVQVGDNVLEVGTGSGYSTALLAELTRSNGSVVSIDVDPEMTQRAVRLVAAAGYANVICITADGRAGWPQRAAYDRVIAWAAATNEVPRAWCDQTRPGALLVVPMRGSDTAWVSVFRHTEHHTLAELERIHGSFIPLTATPFRPWESASA
jgi:protein-L-isoaspartate(D-aspartate) O-methyltransferase